MKNLVFVLFAVLTIMSCQDDSPCYVYNPDESLVTDEVDTALIIELVNYNRTVQCEYERPDGVGVLEFMGWKNLPEMSWDKNLENAAKLQSTYMFETTNFDHFWCDGTTPNDRIHLVSDGNYVVAENIAWGYSDERKLIQDWLNSEGHRKNILNQGFNVFAVANKGGYWTMVLSRKL